jgi:hypothetical protein
VISLVNLHHCQDDAVVDSSKETVKMFFFVFSTTLQNDLRKASPILKNS